MSNWIRVDSHGEEPGEQFARKDAVIRVKPYMQLRAAEPVPGMTVTHPRIMTAIGTEVRLIDGSVNTITGLTPQEVINIIEYDHPTPVDLPESEVE